MGCRPGVSVREGNRGGAAGGVRATVRPHASIARWQAHLPPEAWTVLIACRAKHRLHGFSAIKVERNEFRGR